MAANTDRRPRSRSAHRMKDISLVNSSRKPTDLCGPDDKIAWLFVRDINKCRELKEARGIMKILIFIEKGKVDLCYKELFNLTR